MDEIVHAGFECQTLSFIRDLTVDELIEFITDNIDIYAEAMDAAAMPQANSVCGMYRGTGWRIWFWRITHAGSVH
jgi:hypothetical protein